MRVLMGFFTGTPRAKTLEEELDMNDKTTETPKADAKPAKEKAAPPKRNWKKGEYAGRNVFTAKGKGTVVSQDTEAKRFLVNIDNTDHDMAEGSVNFKAINDKYRDNYIVDKRVKTASGSPSVNCGDDVAAAMLGLADAELATLAKENGLDWSRWAHLNPGMRRMNLGNGLRRIHKAHIANPAENKAVTFFGQTPENAAKKRSDEADKEQADAKATKKANAKATKKANPKADAKAAE